MSSQLIDARLEFLLLGGKALLYAIDPDRITRKATVQKMVLSRGPGADAASWSVTLSFPQRNDGLLVSGVVTADGPEIRGVRLPTDEERLQPKASKTLSGALCPLDRLPVRAKRLLAPAAPETPAVPAIRAFSPDKYFKVATDALFWEIEGGDKEEARRKFDRLVVKFEDEAKVRLSARYRLEEGEIRVECDADAFGLSHKRVTVRKQLGMRYETRAECVLTAEPKDIPSLNVAFDLYDAIPTLYTKERRKNVTLGKPKGK